MGVLVAVWAANTDQRARATVREHDGKRNGVWALAKPREEVALKRERTCFNEVLHFTWSKNQTIRRRLARLGHKSVHTSFWSAEYANNMNI